MSQHMIPAPTSAQSVIVAQFAIDALVALAELDPPDLIACYQIRDALLPRLSPGERERVWWRIMNAERARRHLTCADHGWGPAHFVDRRRDEDDDQHLTRALDEAAHQVRFAATVAVVADTVPDTSVPAQRVDA